MTRGSKADEILTLVLMLLAITAVVCYFVVNGKTVFLYYGGVAIVLWLVQYVLRYIH